MCVWVLYIISTCNLMGSLCSREYQDVNFKCHYLYILLYIYIHVFANGLSVCNWCLISAAQVVIRCTRKQTKKTELDNYFSGVW